MAKQIYIDENGNEQLVSGTINTADMLPIESGSATNTKDYIDTGLSGIIKTATVSGTTTSSGALAIPNTIDPKKILNCITDGTHDYAFPRGDQYLQVFVNNAGVWGIKSSASVSFTVLYIE